jgi:hypothetical protein
VRTINGSRAFQPDRRGPDDARDRIAPCAAPPFCVCLHAPPTACVFSCRGCTGLHDAHHAPVFKGIYAYTDSGAHDLLRHDIRLCSRDFVSHWSMLCSSEAQSVRVCECAPSLARAVCCRLCGLHMREDKLQVCIHEISYIERYTTCCRISTGEKSRIVILPSSPSKQTFVPLYAKLMPRHSCGSQQTCVGSSRPV